MGNKIKRDNEKGEGVMPTYEGKGKKWAQKGHVREINEVGVLWTISKHLLILLYFLE